MFTNVSDWAAKGERSKQRMRRKEKGSESSIKQGQAGQTRVGGDWPD